MGMTVNSNDSDDDVIGTINTTPLVDIMLVLLIIFLMNVPYETKPENIQLAVNKNGDIFWNENYIADKATLLSRLQAEAQKRPQPDVHIRGDQLTPYDAIDQVITTTQQAGIGKIAFVTTPPSSP